MSNLKKTGGSDGDLYRFFFRSDFIRMLGSIPEGQEMSNDDDKRDADQP